MAGNLDFLIIKDEVHVYAIDRMRGFDDLINGDIAAEMLVKKSDGFEERLRLNDPFIKTIVNEGQLANDRA